MSTKANIIIRMGAPYFDVRVRGASPPEGGDGSYVTFDHRTMTKDEKRGFHRELLNAFRLNMPKRAA